MNGASAVGYITNRNWRESRLGLERVNELLSMLGDPHKKLKYIHVAGTNGKGSVCAMLSSILTNAGYKTGLYTSPFINRFNERIQIDGTPIGDAALAESTQRVLMLAEQMDDHPTEFELITAIGFQYFYESGCDVVVLEVGLGGRLDATNVIEKPEVAVITPISFDHVAELGGTLEEIAFEKAGIIKPGCHVVASPQEPGAAKVLKLISADKRAALGFADVRSISVSENTIDKQVFSYKGHEGLEIKLPGAFQTQNAAVVVETIERLRERGWKISDIALREGLAQTRWPARFEVVHRDPWVIVDGGHNPQCVDMLVDNLKTYFPSRKVSFLTGVMADKDFEAMFRKVLPLAKRVYTVTPDNPRALNALTLAEFFRAHGVQEVKACESVEDGIKELMEKAGKDGIVSAFGSFYMAGAIRKAFGLN